MQKNKKWYRRFYYTIFFLLVNVLAVLILGKREAGFVDAAMTGHAEASMDGGGRDGELHTLLSAVCPYHGT